MPKQRIRAIKSFWVEAILEMEQQYTRIHNIKNNKKPRGSRLENMVRYTNNMRKHISMQLNKSSN